MFSLQVCAASKKTDKKNEPTKVKVLLKEARTAIKEKSNQQKAEKNLTDALSRPELTNSERAEILFTAAELRQSINDGENMKAYLKQNYDTLNFFNSILGIYDYVLRCDSVDTLPDQKQRVKPVYTQKCRDLLLKHRKNLLGGGKFLLRRAKYKEAYSYFNTYLISMDHHLIREQVKATDVDSLRHRVEYWATYSAYNAGLDSAVIKHIDKAIDGVPYDSMRMALYEVKSLTYYRMNDSLRYVTSLEEGLEAYPADNYFFLHLMDEIQARKNYEKGIALCDRQLETVGPRLEYFFGKSLMYQRLEQNDSCIAMSDSVLVRDPDNSEALYNKGISYVNKAVEYAETACNDVRNPKCRKDREIISDLYRNALTPFERLRELQPDAVSRWGRPLYRIYLYLNKGKEFEEIDKTLQSMKN